MKLYEDCPFTSCYDGKVFCRLLLTKQQCSIDGNCLKDECPIVQLFEGERVVEVQLEKQRITLEEHSDAINAIEDRVEQQQKDIEELKRIVTVLKSVSYTEDIAALFDKIEKLEKEGLNKLLKRFARITELVEKQAEDEGLWFEAKTAPEAYLQQELRKLHAAIEGGR